MSDLRSDPSDVPATVAIIMDGNGRWAAAHGLPVSDGHRAGTRALRRTVEASIEVGIRTLCVYAFSTENWARPPAEVSSLMEILGETIDTELPDLARQGVRTRFLGRRDGWPGLKEAYGLPQAPRGLDHGLAYEALAAGEIDAMDLYATDAKIERLDIALLADDRQFFPPYEAVLLHREDAPRRHPESVSCGPPSEGSAPGGCRPAQPSSRPGLGDAALSRARIAASHRS